MIIPLLGPMAFAVTAKKTVSHLIWCIATHKPFEHYNDGKRKVFTNYAIFINRGRRWGGVEEKYALP
jgi:hypothetical protein